MLCLAGMQAGANELVVSVSGLGAVNGASSSITISNCRQGSGTCSGITTTTETITLTATPDAGNLFNAWGGDCAAFTGPSCTISIVGHSSPVPPIQNVSASFIADTRDITVTVQGDGTVNGGGVSCPGVCSSSLPLGTTVTLVASANAGNVFDGWQGTACPGSTNPVCTFSLSANQDIQANFVQGSPPPPVDPDGDLDGVPDSADQCPDTPFMEPVDEFGCSESQKDDDEDGVSNDLDECPDTPPGAEVDELGCEIDPDPAPEPEVPDEDEDGVEDDLDQCPETPPGSSVDEDGCAPSQLDSDRDGVSDADDRCPNTPAGDEVDESGCTVMEGDEDEDGDGVIDDEDRCPGTPAGLPVDDFGCSVEQNFGNDLGDIEGLSPNEQVLGSRVDEICPLLLASDIVGELTRGQRDLLDACVGLKSRGTSTDQAADALGEISLTELAAMLDYVVELSNAQHSHLGARLRQVADGGGRGVSVSGLNLRSGDQALPGHVLQSAFDGLLGMAAGDGDFADFGRLGLYLQGDINVGDKDETELENGYDFDAWSVTLGGDYRFTNSFFGGLSLSLGEVEVDYEGLAGSTDIENWSVAAYGGWQITDAWYLDGLISYGSADFEMTRRILYTDVGGRFDSTQQSDTEGDQVYFGLNTGYMWTPLTESGSWRIGPIASLTYLDGTIDGFDETTEGPGSLAWNFIVDDRDYESLRLHLGFQADYIWNTSWGVLIPGLRAAWVMENEDGPEQIDLRLVHNPFGEDLLRSDNISIVTEGRDSSFFDASLNLSAQFQHGFSGFLSYQFYSGYENFSKQGLTFGFRWDKPY